MNIFTIEDVKDEMDEKFAKVIKSLQWNFTYNRLQEPQD